LNRLVHLVGRVLVALITTLLCYPVFFLAWLFLGDPLWRGGVPILDYSHTRSLAALAGWIVIQGFIVWRVDRWVQR